MFQGNWIIEHVTHEHQRYLMETAEKARQLQDVQKNVTGTRRSRHLLAKLRAEMTNL